MNLKRFFNMGLKDKVGVKAQAETPNLPDRGEMVTQKEASFIIAKLRQATYTGSEFETFYTVMTKLQSFIEKK